MQVLSTKEHELTLPILQIIQTFFQINQTHEAIQVKLDELIRATKGAHNILLDLEDMDDVQMDEIRNRYQLLARLARDGIATGLMDTDTPEFNSTIEK